MTGNGFTVVDSFYEYLGCLLCQGMDGVLRGFWVPFIVALGGCVYVFVRASDRGQPRMIAAYFLYLVLMVWMLAPITLDFGRPHFLHADEDGNIRQGPADKSVQVRVPRIACRANQAIDAVVRNAMPVVNRSFGRAPFEWQRIARMASTARITDGRLLRDYRTFLKGCYMHLVSRLPEGEPLPAPLDPSTSDAYLPSDRLFRDGTSVPCRAAVGRLRSAMLKHLRTSESHRRVLAAAKRYDGGQGFEEAYLRTVCETELFAPHLHDGEEAAAGRSTGSLDYFELPATASAGGLLRSSLQAVGMLKQEYALIQEPRQKHYLVCLFGPHIYGFTLAILLGLFPVVGAWAIAPDGWKALVNWGKVYLSVKLWPLVWAALTSVSQARMSIEAVSELPAMSMRDVYLGAVSMYFLTPALTFLVVNLGVRAAAAAISHAVPPPAGSVSPQPAINVAARGAGRLMK
ncbi:MAG: hypothetical protein ACYTAF_04145 [Planctomycetota bacterium]|jgi:hypothetical protein